MSPGFGFGSWNDKHSNVDPNQTMFPSLLAMSWWKREQRLREKVYVTRGQVAGFGSVYRQMRSVINEKRDEKAVDRGQAARSKRQTRDTYQ